MPMLHVKVEGLSDGGYARCGGFRRTVADLRPFWRSLGETLADDAQARWPLRRRSGQAPQSRWSGAGDSLWAGAVSSSPSPDLLKFGSADLLFSRFAQFGTKRQRQRHHLIHIDEPAHSRAVDGPGSGTRAAASGLEVDGMTEHANAQSSH